MDRPRGRAAFLAVVTLGVVCAGCFFRDAETRTPPDTFLFRTPIDVERRFSVFGNGVPDRATVTDAELSAACQSFEDAERDEAVSSDVIMLDDPALLRSAELLDGTYRDDPIAFEMEALLVTGEYSELQAFDEIAERFTQAELEVAQRYAADRREPPTDHASAYVVYATLRTTGSVYLNRRIIEPRTVVIDDAGRSTIDLERPDGEEIEIPPSWCSTP